MIGYRENFFLIKVVKVCPVNYLMYKNIELDKESKIDMTVMHDATMPNYFLLTLILNGNYNTNEEEVLARYHCYFTFLPPSPSLIGLIVH